MTRRGGQRSASGHQGGIALVLVLWVIALMTVIALSVSSLSRTEVLLARNRVDEARIRALADAAVAQAVLHLSAPEEEDFWLPDGSPHDWVFAGNTLRISITNEASRADLNRASDLVLEKLLRAADPENTNVEALVAAVLDWRDGDESSRPQGAERSDYRADGRPYGSQNGPFREAAEIGQVLGVSQELAQRLVPHLTVDSPNSRVDLDYADPFVRGALSEDESDSPVVDADAPSGREPERDQDREGALKRGGPTYRIHVNLADGGPAMETLIRLGGRGAGMTVLWRRLDWQPQSAADED
jgi:general secretion pathway protein K